MTLYMICCMGSYKYLENVTKIKTKKGVSMNVGKKLQENGF